MQLAPRHAIYTRHRLELPDLRFSSTRNVYRKPFGDGRLTMINLLQRVGYILLVLAVISLFVCTIPVWLIVLVVLLLLW